MANTQHAVPVLKALADTYFTDGTNVDHVLMHQLLHHTIEFKRVMDAVGAFWTVHDVEQVAKVSDGIGKHVHLLRAKAKEDKYVRSKESAAIASIADPAFMIVPAHPQPIVAPAADIQTVDSFNPNLRVPGSPPPRGLID